MVVPQVVLIMQRGPDEVSGRGESAAWRAG